MKNKNMLASGNCNKAMCKSCIFREDGKAVQLAPGRMEEIKQYLIGQASHICHVTNKTCYGGLTYQATMFYRIGVIAEESVECLLRTVNEILKHRQ